MDAMRKSMLVAETHAEWAKKHGVDPAHDPRYFDELGRRLAEAEAAEASSESSSDATPHLIQTR